MQDGLTAFEGTLCLATIFGCTSAADIVGFANVTEISGVGEDSMDDQTLRNLSIKERALLPKSVLEEIIRRGNEESGANPMGALEMQRAIEAVRKGHWVRGISQTNPTEQQISDLFGG